MKLLLLDDDYIITEQLNCLTKLENNWQIVQIGEVSYNEIDLVIVNIFNEKYNQILQNILEQNPQIKTLTVSDKLTSKLSKGCEYCTSNYNRKRLIKPIKLKVLYNTLKNFDEIPTCPLMDAFENIENLIPIIIQQFKTLLYDEKSQIISSTADSESKEHTVQILALLTLLDQNQIQYTLLNENSVKVHI